ncbi:lysoplasmalogenase [Nocardioides sp. GY 10113]|uniref:lysoplasmalogenase n=1 Tax=Nocardioides sp. GY 10113 TaxID=2569761 RepID=UPI0010A7C44C|nr:lysoplasmalogenase [Nocardioides sp. GY 10113]TIC84813.1 lysoplasmalogenase [Nocardioides sp. GY 10113]
MRRHALTAYAVVAVANVVGNLLDDPWLAHLTKPLLVPLLLAVLLLGVTDRGSRLVRAATVALVFCWLGDLALMGGDDWFLVGLGAFLLGQVGYCTAFATTWSRNPIRDRKAVALPYLAWWALLLVALGPDLGGLIAPVAVYGAVLCTMAALALGVHRLTAVGAVSFVLSDSLIAATSLSDRFAFDASGAAVMATYTLGQALIVLGVIAAASTETTARAAADGEPAAR